MAEDTEWDWAEEGDAESFIAEYELDEAAANALRTQSADVVQNVLSQGPLLGNNPSAILMSRIRQASSHAATDWESFLEVVDDSAREQFMAQEKQVMDAIMEEGPLTGNNPSAILVGRIRKVKQSLGKAAGGSKKATDAAMAARRRAGELGGGGAGGSSKSSSQGVAKQQKVRQQALQEAQKVQANDSGQSWPQGDALQNLASLLCQLNSAMWNLDAPHEDVVAIVKEALKARKAAVAVVLEAEWPEEWLAADPAGQVEPPKKRARPAASAGGADPPQVRELPTEEREQRQELVLQEVLRLLQEAGGAVALQDLGSTELTSLRKGAVGNLRKFLSSRPDAVTVDPSDPSGLITVSLVC